MAAALTANFYGVAVEELEISALTHADVHLAQTNPVKYPNLPVQVGVRMVIVASLVTGTTLAVVVVTAMTMMMMPTAMTMMTTMTLLTLMTMGTICQMLSPSAIPAWIQDQRVQKLLKLRIAAMRTDYYE